MKVQSLLTLLVGTWCLLSGGVCAGEVTPWASSAPQDLVSLKAYAQKHAKAPLLERDTFIRQSPLKQVLLAPSGEAIVYLVESQRTVDLWVYYIEQNQHSKLISTKNVDEIHWSANSKGVYFVAAQTLYYLDVATKGRAKRLFDFKLNHTKFYRPDPDKPKVYWYRQYVPKVQRYQLFTGHIDGHKKLIFESDKIIKGIHTENGKLQIVTLWEQGRTKVYEVMPSGLSVLVDCGVSQGCSVHGFDKQKRRLVVSGYFGNDKRSLYLFDLDSDTRRLIHQDPTQRFDLNALSLDYTGNPIMVSYETDYLTHYGLTDNVQNILASIDDYLDSHMWSVSTSLDQQTWLVVDRNPNKAVPTVLLYQPAEGKWLSPLKEIDNAQPYQGDLIVSPRLPFWYPATDGMMLQGYITVPLGSDLKQVPLIVHPHGGPWSRATGQYNRIVQFLTNRGYAVFEPNFRGSTGLGRNYMLAANRAFGKGRVHQDIMDGMTFLLNNGIGHSDKLAIAGHSFGGFSTLTALAFDPEVFSVGFAGAAPSHIAHSIMHYQSEIPLSERSLHMYRFIDLLVDLNDAADRERLYLLSPHYARHQIVKPVIMWAGGKDDRVAIEQVREFALRLQAQGTSVFLLADPNEGHNPKSEIAREAYLLLLEYALHYGLGGALDASISQRLSDYLAKYTIIDNMMLISEIPKITKQSDKQ